MQVSRAAATDSVCDRAGGARRCADEQALHRPVPPRLPHRPPAHQAAGARLSGVNAVGSDEKGSLSAAAKAAKERRIY